MRKATFAEILIASRPEANFNLWNKAGDARTIAKAVGLDIRSRSIAYEVKDSSLEQLVKRGVALVRPHIQHSGHVLLGVIDGSRRLHAPTRHQKRFEGGGQIER